MERRVRERDNRKDGRCLGACTVNKKLLRDWLVGFFFFCLFCVVAFGF